MHRPVQSQNASLQNAGSRKTNCPGTISSYDQRTATPWLLQTRLHDWEFHRTAYRRDSVVLTLVPECPTVPAVWDGRELQATHGRHTVALSVVSVASSETPSPRVGAIGAMPVDGASTDGACPEGTNHMQTSAPTTTPAAATAKPRR